MKRVLHPLVRSVPGAPLTRGYSPLAPTRWGWGWIILVLASSAGGNLLSFEGRELLRPSNESWTVRVRQLKILTVGGV
jgi:hypothetical protein